MRRDRIPELDGIRGLAILLVVFWHYIVLEISARPATVLSYIQAAGRLAWSGVDLFFVLSGFLIGGILLDSRESPDYFRTFYRRRFFRIIPLYALFLAFYVVLDQLVDRGLAPKFSVMFSDRLPWFSYPLFLQNFWMAKRSTLGGVWGLGGTWSLAVEEQFYLAVPLLIRFLKPRLLTRVLVGGILLAEFLRIAFYLHWPNKPFMWFVLMPCRADALLLGTLGAVALRNPRSRLWLKNHRTSMLGSLLVLAAGVLVLTAMKPSPVYALQLRVPLLLGGYTWLALFYLSLILYAVVHTESSISRCLRWRWLRWIGSVAYGMYLYHGLPLAFFFCIFGGRNPYTFSSPVFAATTASFAITLAMCWFSWRYFEKPLIDMGHRPSRLQG